MAHDPVTLPAAQPVPSSASSLRGQLAGLWTRTRERWKFAAALAVVGGIAGIGASFLIRPLFTSTAAFQAETASFPSLGGSLAGLAAQFGGIQLGGGSGNPQLLAELLGTEAVLRPVVHDSLPWDGAARTLIEIYRLDRKAPRLAEFLAMKRLRNRITSSVNLRTGSVQISVEAWSPELAQAVAASLLRSLNAANIDLRRSRAGAEREFTAQQAENARRDLRQAEDALAAFSQRNRSIASAPALQIEESRLMRAVDMAQQVYVQLRLQEEQAAVQALRTTPTLSTLEPPTLPVRKSSPKRKFAGLLGAVAGLSVALLVINGRALLGAYRA